MISESVEPSIQRNSSGATSIISARRSNGYSRINPLCAKSHRP